MTKIGFEIVRRDNDVPFSNDALNKIYEKIAYHTAKEIESILEQVIEDNSNIDITDMVIVYNTNLLPVRIVTKDERVLYDFERD